MTRVELAEKRLLLQQWISESGEEALHAVDMIRKSYEQPSEWRTLEESTRRLIEKGIADADAGRSVDSETFWKTLRG